MERTKIEIAPSLRSFACWDALRALSSPQRTRQICPEAGDRIIAWKTGTSSGRRDAWCAAVTPHRTIVVWLGNGAGQGADSLIGIDAAAPLALRLMASIDRTPCAWPDDERLTFSADREESQVAGRSLSTPTSARRLALISPVAHQHIVYNNDIEPGKQRLALRASGVGDQQLWWFIDGQEVGHGAGDQVVWWPSVPGEHHLRVFDAQGHAAAVSFDVR